MNTRLANQSGNAAGVEIFEKQGDSVQTEILNFRKIC